ncbi:MAG: hypothetical protein CSA66_03865 [Proteobacteria bacterium]|nr:MAG: hypothetical protein CSA66_03865 [Pseudomonadota bacterium]
MGQGQDSVREEPDAAVISHEWDAFVRRGTRPTKVAPCVQRSWERSRALGVDPFGGRSELVLSRAELQRQIADNQRLVETVRPYMHQVYDAARGCHHLIYLTDASGTILALQGDSADKAAFERRYNFKVGASWSEQAVGTTAVSVALSEDTTVPYLSSAKFCRDLQGTSCAAIPLHDDDEALVGVLGIATDSTDLNPQIFWLLVSAQMGIENRFRLRRYEEDIAVLHHSFRSVLDGVSDVIVSVDGDGRICDINSAAEELLDLRSKQVRGRRAEDVLDFSPTLLNSTPSSGGAGGFLRDRRKRIYPLRREIASASGRGAVRTFIFGRQGAASRVKRSLPRPAPSSSSFTFDELVGEDPAFLAVKAQAQVAASCEASVLICGESGTGKELFARAIHSAGARAGGPFVAINCGALPRDLVQSELFGYAPFAFTGADRRGRAGCFEQAHSGTIFLDEIGEMPEDAQVSLLRVLQERHVTRVGGSELIPVDVRVIAATHKEMFRQVQQGRFRADLFWRLNVIDLQLPTLAERRSDIPILVDHFLRKHGRGACFGLDRWTAELLRDYPWPGNVRELDNAIQRAVVFSPRGTITVDALPAHLRAHRAQAHRLHAPSSLQQGERRHIEHVLRQNDYNISRSARILGIARNTLYNKIRRYGLGCAKSEQSAQD